MRTRTLTAIALIFVVFTVAFAPAPFGLGSAIPAVMMIRLPLFAILCALLAYAVSAEQPAAVVIAGVIVELLWLAILPIALRDPLLHTKASIPAALLAKPDLLLSAVNAPHYFNRGIWQNQLTLVPVITALFAFQAYRIRALARRSAAQEASHAALAAHFAPDIANLLLQDRDGGLKPRRQHVVAMSCDLVGFTTMAEQEPAEDVAALLRAYRSAVERAVFAGGGAIVSFTGDGALAAFGLHDATDAAGRAVASARCLIQNWPGPVPIAVGLAAGEAIIGLNADGGAALVFQGPPVADAERLQQATRAEGVSIIASDAVVASLGPDMKPLAQAKSGGAWHIAT